MAMVCFITILAIISTLRTAQAVKPIKIAAFNVQVFGQAKISKNYVVDILAQIVNRYDIILIQEIRDAGNSKLDPIKVLLEKANKLAQSSGSSQYNVTISERLGRTVSKEQYAFFYRKNITTFKTSYTYVDKNDDFEREPYVVHFNVPSAAVSDLVFIAIHTKPDDAVKEVDKLVDVYDDAVKRWKIKNAVILGDLNAACDYVRDTDWVNIRLAKDKRFWWLIDDCQDTSVQGSRCAYDRFIATGNDLLKNIVAESAGLFNFKSAHNLSTQKAAEVSDHFPIEFEIKEKGWKEVETVNYVLRSVVPKRKQRALYSKLRNRDNGAKSIITTLYTKTGGKSRIVLSETKTSIASAIAYVQNLHSTYSTFMGDIQVVQAERYLNRLGASQHPYQVFSQYRNIIDIQIEVQLIWDVAQSPMACHLVISKSLSHIVYFKK